MGFLTNWSEQPHFFHYNNKFWAHTEKSDPLPTLSKDKAVGKRIYSTIQFYQNKFFSEYLNSMIKSFNVKAILMMVGLYWLYWE